MDRTERLLSTLAQRESMLRQAQTDASRAGTLARAMDLIYHCEDPEQGIVDVLELCRRATGSDGWMLLGASDGGATTVLAASNDASRGGRWPAESPVLSRAIRMNDLCEADWAAALPDGMRACRSLLSTPVEVPFQSPLVIGLLSHRRALYSSDDLDLLRRVGDLTKQVLAIRLLSQRNAALTMIVDASPGDAPPQSRFLDRSFETLSRAFGRVAHWQGRIVDITNQLLSAPTRDADRSIEHALRQTGELAAADRTYVFRLRSAEWMDNTHEWVASGIVPMIGQLKDQPVDLLSEWREDFLAGRTVHIADVDALPAASAVREVLKMQQIRSLLAVPMLKDGEITGFVGYDSVRAHRQYHPLEIQLLRSVCNAIGAVIERTEAEARAEMARQSLHATLLAVPDLVLELDRDGRFTGTYDGPGQPAAFPRETILGRTPEEIMPPHLAALARKIMRIVDRDGRTDSHEYQMVVGGESRSFMLSAAAKIMAGRPVGYVFATRDVTRRLLERRQLQRLSKIAELTSNMVVITDARQRIEWVNPAFERHTGWTLAEVRGRRPDSFLATERTDSEELARIGRLLRARQPVRAELLNRNRAGEEYWISKDIQPLFDERGIIEGFVAVQTDITELKQSHLRALRDRAMALDASSDGIAITDETGHYLYMNPAHRAMFGIDRTEDVGRLHWKDLYTPEAIARFMAEDWPRFQDYGVWRGELFGRHRDGRIVAQEVSLTRREKGLLCISRDISERLRLEADRARLREDLQLAQSRETIAHLAAGVAHDLNNLVAVVAGSAMLLRTMCDDSPEAKSGLGRILRATETATELVGGLAHLGRPQRTRSRHDLRTIIGSAIDLLGTQRVRAHDITAALPDAACPIWANVTEALQVVINLLLNACQASGTGPNTVTLSIDRPGSPLPAANPDVGYPKRDEAHEIFRISDTGTGIEPDTQARLFDRYFSTKGNGGTGLGLPIVAGILRDNAAALWIDSTVGKGTTVTVAWPTGPTTRAPDTPVAAPRAAPADLARHRILVVDDMPDVADMLSEMLETADAISVAVTDPKEALELLKENPGLWSALVTDQDMPDLRGTDLARVAAACDPVVPTVLVTAMPDAVGFDAPLFHAVLAKPVSADRLIAAVGRAVASRTPPLAAADTRD
jgi:PAS domain S-box-containing protein